MGISLSPPPILGGMWASSRGDRQMGNSFGKLGRSLSQACEMKKSTPLSPVKGERAVSSRAVAEPRGASLEKENLPAFPAPALLPPRRTRSFAPQNFVFQPLQGLAAYQVKPMSPSRASVFLSPDLIWSPVNSTRYGPCRWPLPVRGL